MRDRQLGPVGFHRRNQIVFNLFLDCIEPALGVSGATLKTFDLALKLTDSILGGSQLHRKLMRDCHGSVELLVRDIRGFP